MAAEKMTKTVAVVKAPREFTTNDGKALVAHDVVFDDGEEGGVITGPSAADSEAMQTALNALKGEATEFEVDGFREYQGNKKWKVINFPNKPRGSGGGGGGKRDWVDQSPSMEAQGAVKNAIAAIGSFNTKDFPDGTPEYIGMVREMAKGLYKVVQEIKGPGEAPKPEENYGPMQQDAIRIFGTPARVILAYRKMFESTKAFDAITDEELVVLIEQKNAEEAAG